MDEQQQEIFPGGWKKGDVCFLITSKAKRYALPHTVESFDGTYFGVRGRTGLFHHASPRRLFRTKEDAIASLDMPKRVDTPQQNMSKDTFWSLIASAKEVSGQDMDAYLKWITERLTTMGPQAAQDFHDIMHGYRDLAYQYGLWSAASLMCDMGCTDDGFIDFRAWLIAQGRQVYLAALADPDSLSQVECYGGCQFELLSYVGDEVLEKLTGRSAYDCTDDAAYDKLLKDLQGDIAYGEGINYPYEWDELPVYFPRLCKKHLEPGDVEFHQEMGHTMWFLDNENIQKARENGPPLRKGPQFEMQMGGM